MSSYCSSLAFLISLERFLMFVINVLLTLALTVSRWSVCMTELKVEKSQLIMSKIIIISDSKPHYNQVVKSTHFNTSFMLSVLIFRPHWYSEFTLYIYIKFSCPVWPASQAKIHRISAYSWMKLYLQQPITLLVWSNNWCSSISLPKAFTLYLEGQKFCIALF